MSFEAESFEKHLNRLLAENKIDRAFYNQLRDSLGRISPISREKKLTDKKRPSLNLLMSMIAYSRIEQTEQQLKKTEDEMKTLAVKWDKKKIDEKHAKKEMGELALTEKKLKKTLETMHKLSEFPFETYLKELTDLESKRKKAKRVYEKKRLTKVKYEKVLLQIDKKQNENIKELKTVLAPLRIDLAYFSEIIAIREANDAIADHPIAPYVQKFRDRLVELENQYPELQLPKFTINDFLNEIFTQFEQISLHRVHINLRHTDSLSFGQSIIELPSESSLEDVPQVLPTKTENTKFLPIQKTEPTLQPITDPWEITGQILLDPKEEILGICSEPVIYEDKVYIPVSKEAEIEMELTDRIFRDVQSLTITHEISTSETRQNLIRAQIAETLNIRPAFALYPTFVTEFCAAKKISIPPTLKIEKKTTKYFPFETISRMPENNEFFTTEEFYQRALDQIFPAPSLQTIRKADLIGKTVRKWTHEPLGTITDVINHPISQEISVIELYSPSEEFLQLIQQKVLDPKEKDKGLWYLRFVISKALGISDGESLTIAPLWRFCWKRKFPLLPWELEVSYIGLTSIGAIQQLEEWVLLKRGVVVRSLKEMYVLPRESNLVNSSSGETEGRILGLSYNRIQKKPVLLYTPRSLEEILEALGRTPSTSYQQKLKKRIARALDIPIDYSLELAAVIKYFINFVPFSEDLSLIQTAKKWIKEIVDQRIVPLDKIVKIEGRNVQVNI